MKFLLYLLITPFVIVSLDSLRINEIFKKNKVFQARLFYFFLAISMIYLVTNMIYETANLSKLF